MKFADTLCSADELVDHIELLLLRDMVRGGKARCDELYATELALEIQENNKGDSTNLVSCVVTDAINRVKRHLLARDGF